MFPVKKGIFKRSGNSWDCTYSEPTQYLEIVTIHSSYTFVSRLLKKRKMILPGGVCKAVPV